MLDQDGDGQITYEELMATIKEATEASELEGEGGRERVGFKREMPYYITSICPPWCPPASLTSPSPSGMAAKVGKSIQVNETLERTREVLKGNKKVGLADR